MAFDLDASFNELGSATGLSPGFFKGILGVENPGQNPAALGKNADGTTDHGLWQINSQHLPFLQKNGIANSLEDLNNPEINTNAAKALFADLKRQGAKTPEQYAAGYNTGSIRNVSHPYVGKVMGKVNGENAASDDTGTANVDVSAQLKEPPGTPADAGTGTFELGKNSKLVTDFLEQATGALKQGAEYAQSGAAKVESVTGEIKTAILDLGTALAESVRGTQALTLKKEADAKTIQGTFGLDINAADNIISSGAVEATALEAQHKVAYDRYSQLNEVSFFDNPLKWLGAQLSLPQAAAQVNNLSAKYSDVVNKTNNAIATMSGAVQATNLAAATTTAQQAETLAKAQVLQSVEAAAKAGLIGEEQKNKLLLTIAPMTSTAAQLVMGGVSLDINYANKLYAQWVKGIQLDEKAVKDREQAAAVEDAKISLNRANAVMGTQYTFGQVKGMPKASQEILGRIGALGALGQTIPEVLANQKYMGNTPDTAGAKKTLERVQDEYARQVKLLEQTIPDKKLAAETAGFTVQRTFKLYSEDVSTGENNPYKGGAPGAILANNPALVARIPLLAKAMEPILGQSQPLDYNTIADLVVKTASTGADGKPTVPNGKVLSQLSMEMETYFKAVVDNNNRTFRYSTLALPAQDGYKSKATGLLGQSAIVDGTNRAANMSILLQKSVKYLESSGANEQFRLRPDLQPGFVPNPNNNPLSNVPFSLPAVRPDGAQ